MSPVNSPTRPRSYRSLLLHLELMAWTLLEVAVVVTVYVLIFGLPSR